MILFALIALIHQIADSGRIVELATPASDRVSTAPQIAPGAPPLLSLRLLEGRQRQRFGNLDLVLDDAGH
jgi:hypothetical protein